MSFRALFFLLFEYVDRLMEFSDGEPADLPRADIQL